MTDIIEKKQRRIAVLDTTKINHYIKVGEKDMYWYHECQEVFEDIFGKDELWLVCQLFAGTSINTSMKSNLTLFRRAYYEIKNDLPIGKYLPNIQTQLQRIRSGQELSGRKINAFAKAMSGVPDQVVVDVWLCRAFGIDRKYVRYTGPHAGLARSGGPTDREYTLVENWVREEADRRNIEARMVSAMIWAGVRISTNGDRHTHYKDLLKHAFTNLFGVI